ncbi:MAG: hypothetical protein AAGI90_06150 [Chlamydiota bacterium]
MFIKELESWQCSRDLLTPFSEGSVKNVTFFFSNPFIEGFLRNLGKKYLIALNRVFTVVEKNWLFTRGSLDIPMALEALVFLFKGLKIE